MNVKNWWKDQQVKNAILIGTLCSVSYLGVYIVRNILGTVTPQMIESTSATTEYIGELSSLFFVAYAVGQLVNGIIGDKIKASYMMTLGLLLAGICNIVFPGIAEQAGPAKIIYGLSGFFLSMIYAPMTKLVSENTKPMHAVYCSVGFTSASLLGSPFAGVLAAVATWDASFIVGSVILLVMGVACFAAFLWMEKKGIVKYNQYTVEESGSPIGGIKVLLKHQIVKFTIISIITGVVRTTVVFWLPTYLVQYLGFGAKQSASLFTVATLVISLSTFIAVFVYERLGRNMDLTILLSFIVAAAGFLGVFVIKASVITITLMVVAILAANAASSMLWSKYCPGLRDTGMVSSATGFLDFASYMAAAISSSIFANAVSSIGWGNLILIWFGLMAVGVVVSLPLQNLKQRLVKEK